MSQRPIHIDTDGAGCVLLALGVGLFLIILGLTVLEHGWPGW